MTCKDKASYDSTPPCTIPLQLTFMKKHQPVKALAGRLEQTLARMQVRRAHKQALRLYKTDNDSWKALSSQAEKERQQRVAAASTESRELVTSMDTCVVYVWVWVWVCVCIYIYTLTRIHTHTPTHAHTHLYIYMCVWVYMYIYMLCIMYI